MHEWMEHARCREEDPELFFPPGSFRRAYEQMERARLVCLRCPVVGPCLDLALRTRADDGVWGGATPYERKLIRRRLGQGSAELRDRPTPVG